MSIFKLMAPREWFYLGLLACAAALGLLACVVLNRLWGL
jgi:hypothetical protein